jgi:Membrane-bound toxin component of toxin-antitoxin system
LSAKYSTSPSLRLIVGNSALRRVLLAGLFFCAVYSLYRLSISGYPSLALSLLPLAGLCCRRLSVEPLRGAAICWQRGEWTLERGGDSTAIRIHPGSSCLPWLICLVWTELPAGRKRRLWLFVDSADERELRNLRVRLTLQR